MRSDRILFVTGTDTGVGKTFVAAALLRALTRYGKRAVGVKPVETGCGREISHGEDGAILATATEQASPRAALCRLKRPVAPPVAADIEGAKLSIDDWCDTIERLSEQHDLVMVEGAGGLLSPLTWDCTLRDMIARTRARTLVVAADRLGTINHTLLTLDALTTEITGVVFSAPPAPDESTGSNLEALRRVRPGVRSTSLARHRDWQQASSAVDEIAGWVDR